MVHSKTIIVIIVTVVIFGALMAVGTGLPPGWQSTFIAVVGFGILG